MCSPRLGASVESEAFIAALEALAPPKIWSLRGLGRVCCLERVAVPFHGSADSDRRGQSQGKYRDPSLGVVRFRERLRRLRMTISRLGKGCGWMGLVGLLIPLRKDSGVELLPWRKFGALLLGEEEMYSGEFGASRAAEGGSALRFGGRA